MGRWNEEHLFGSRQYGCFFFLKMTLGSLPFKRLRYIQTNRMRTNNQFEFDSNLFVLCASNLPQLYRFRSCPFSLFLYVLSFAFFFLVLLLLPPLILFDLILFISFLLLMIFFCFAKMLIHLSFASYCLSFSFWFKDSVSLFIIGSNSMLVAPSLSVFLHLFYRYCSFSTHNSISISLSI